MTDLIKILENGCFVPRASGHVRPGIVFWVYQGTEMLLKNVIFPGAVIAL